MHQKKAQKILSSVQETYNFIAGEFSQSRQFIGKEFDLFIPYLQPHQHMVDLGCGNGRLLKFLTAKQKDFHYIGIDNSEALLEEAKKLYPQSHFVLGDQLQIPLSDDKTDLLFNLRAFHHIPTEKLQLQALEEMKRILKPNGILILTVWNLWQKRYWREIIRAFFKSIITVGGQRFNDTFIPWNKKQLRYYHAFTAGELKKLLRKSGFFVLKFVSRREQKEMGIHDYVVVAKKLKK